MEQTTRSSGFLVKCRVETGEYSTVHSCQIHVSWLKSGTKWNCSACNIWGGQREPKFFGNKIWCASRLDPSSLSFSEGVFYGICDFSWLCQKHAHKNVPISSPAVVLTASNPWNCETLFLLSPTYVWLFSVYSSSLSRITEWLGLERT